MQDMRADPETDTTHKSTGDFEEVEQNVATTDAAAVEDQEETELDLATLCDNPRLVKVLVTSCGAKMWPLLRLHTEGEWGTLEEGISPGDARGAVGEPTTIREDGAYVIYMYRIAGVVGSLTFVDGRLATWKEPKLPAEPPISFLEGISAGLEEDSSDFFEDNDDEEKDTTEG